MSSRCAFAITSTVAHELARHGSSTPDGCESSWRTTRALREPADAEVLVAIVDCCRRATGLEAAVD